MFKESVDDKLKRLDRKIKKLEDIIYKLNAKEERNFLAERKLENANKKIKYYRELKDIYANNTNEDARVLKGLLKQRNQRQEILYGNLLPTILAICLPLALYSFFNSFYNLIDSMMCSKISASAVNSVAILSQVKNTISAFGAGVAGGGAVLVSRYYGAGKIDKAKNCSGNVLAISIILSLILCLIFVPFASGLLYLVDVPNEGSTTVYFQLQMLELAIVAINTAFVGLEKVKGNSKRVFVLNIIVLMIKLLLNYIFIYQLNVKSIIWVELSTIVAQCFMLTVAIRTFFSRKNALQIKFSDIRPRKFYIVPILTISIPIFLGKFVMSLGKVVVNKLSSTFYNATTDGLIAGALSVSNTLSGLITSPTSSFEDGQSTIVAQNIGNKNYKRTFECFKKTILVVMTISITGYILVRFIFMDQLINLFNTKEVDGELGNELVTYIKQVFRYDSLSIISLGFTSSVLGLLYGYGKTFMSSILNFSRIATRIISLVSLHAAGVGYVACGIAMGISNIIIGILALIALIVFLISYKKSAKQREAELTNAN